MVVVESEGVLKGLVANWLKMCLVAGKSTPRFSSHRLRVEAGLAGDGRKPVVNYMG